MTDNLFDQSNPIARSTDPPTSAAAALEAAKHHPDDAVAAIVASIMLDGVPRIDEEISKAGRAMGHKLTGSRFRHGRKLLVDQGRIVATGNRRPTSNGGRSMEWRIVVFWREGAKA